MAIKLCPGQLTLEQPAVALAMLRKLVTDSFTVLPVVGEQFRAAAHFVDQHALKLRAGNTLRLAITLQQGSTLVTLDRGWPGLDQRSGSSRATSPERWAFSRKPQRSATGWSEVNGCEGTC